MLRGPDLPFEIMSSVDCVVQFNETSVLILGKRTKGDFVLDMPTKTFRKTKTMPRKTKDGKKFENYVCLRYQDDVLVLSDHFDYNLFSSRDEKWDQGKATELSKEIVLHDQRILPLKNSFLAIPGEIFIFPNAIVFKD